MKIAVIRFPGANCDQDALFALTDVLRVEAEYVWHESSSLDGFDGAFLPGGFSYGDYLRCGAMAARAPIMSAVKEFADCGKPVIGVCNGFQVLCEAGILPGALLKNASERFVCRHIFLRADDRTSIWNCDVDRLLKLPVAHGEGRYFCDEPTLAILEEQNRVAFRYVNKFGDPTEESNPNGSISNIAGILNEKKNVLGIMPHPERASRKMLGSEDGLTILNGFKVLALR